MQGAEASKSKTRLLLENKKQNTFDSENNLKSLLFPYSNSAIVSLQIRISQDTDTNSCGVRKHQKAKHVHF